MNRWLRGRLEKIRKIEGYRKPERYENVLRLDTNENIALPAAFVKGILKEAISTTDVREYPSEQFYELKARLSKYLNVPEECISVGNGSDQIIDLILSTFADSAYTVTIKPTFTFYRDRCMLRSIAMHEINLDNNLSFNIEDILKSEAQICYICSPNNPTGNQFDKEKMLELIEEFKGLVIVDEAYVEFAEYSLKDLVKKLDNLIILRTMSKAFGLAGARVGYMISNEEITDLFTRVIQYPYPVSSLSLRAASIALTKLDYIYKVIKKVKEERSRVYEAINSMNLQAFKSDTNFIFFESRDKIFEGLIRNGVLVRYIGNVGIYNNCLRVSIGNRSMNNKFINALRVVT